jgi:hypothetical protein
MKATDKRTQIYLTEAQHRAAMTLARRRGGSLAGVVRNALDRYLIAAVHHAEATWDSDPSYALIGTLPLPERPARAALAEHIDHTVYEEDLESWSSPTAPASSPRSTQGRRARASRRGVASDRERA